MTDAQLLGWCLILVPLLIGFHCCCLLSEWAFKVHGGIVFAANAAPYLIAGIVLLLV